jgi:hypothetical protein
LPPAQENIERAARRDAGDIFRRMRWIALVAPALGAALAHRAGDPHAGRRPRRTPRTWRSIAISYRIGLPRAGVWRVRLSTDSRAYGADY